MHFLAPRSYERIVPPPLTRYRRQVVAASGAAELLGAATVLPARTRRFARWWLLATLVAVFPANIHMALNADRFPKLPPWTLWARLPLQLLFGWHIWRGTTG